MSWDRVPNGPDRGPTEAGVAATLEQSQELPARVQARGPRPLSESLRDLLLQDRPGEVITMNTLLERTEGRGLYLMMIILCLPFVIPCSIPGASGLLGSVILVLAIRLALSLPARLPDFIGRRPLRMSNHPKVLNTGVRFLQLLEKCAKPRRTAWMQWRLARAGNALLIAFMAFLLALPLPIPLTNTLPCYAIVLLAASMMEGDGILVWAGYFVSLFTVGYFAFWAEAIVAILSKHMQQILRLVGIHL